MTIEVTCKDTLEFRIAHFRVETDAVEQRFLQGFRKKFAFNTISAFGQTLRNGFNHLRGDAIGLGSHPQTVFAIRLD